MTKQQVLVGVLEEFFSESQIDYILSLLYSWTGNYDDVENWLHSPIPALGYISAIEACNRGLASEVISYISGIEQGGYA